MTIWRLLVQTSTRHDNKNGLSWHFWRLMCGDSSSFNQQQTNKREGSINQTWGFLTPKTEVWATKTNTPDY